MESSKGTLWTGHPRLGDALFTHTLFAVYLGLLPWGGLWLRENGCDRRCRSAEQRLDPLSKLPLLIGLGRPRQLYLAAHRQSAQAVAAPA